MLRLLVLALPALLAATAAHAATIPGAADSTPAPAAGATAAPAPAPLPAPAQGAALLAGSASDTTSQRFIAIAVGAAAGALMPQLTVVDGLVLMGAVMGGMVGDMAYNGAHGMMQK